MAGHGKAMRTVELQKSSSGLRVRNTRTKRHSFHATRRQMFLIVFMLLLLMGSSIGYVWSNFETTQIGYDLSQLKKEGMRLREIQQKLRLELAYLRSPQRLQKLAFQELGLRQPSTEQIIVLP
ncbi:MAG: cell division protein FtsL [Deltaproteobacteria bacterium]|nr:cell division protein FtsL [Deltaproteobacteria bacterium]